MATNNHANPSRDPANDDSLLGMARQILDKFLQGVDDMLPARVVSYDRTTNRAQVVPMVKVITTADEQITRAQIASVPVMQFGGAGVALSFNLMPGDLGWIKANDRDVSLVLQAYRDSAPNTLRKHSFQDAVFIPDVMHGVMIQGEDEGNAVLQTLDGSIRVAIWPDRLKLTAGALSVTMGPTETVFVGPVTFQDPVVMQSTLDVTGVTTLGSLSSSSLDVSGDATVQGHSDLQGGATIGVIEFGTHVHTDVVPGGGNSGGPV